MIKRIKNIMFPFILIFLYLIFVYFFVAYEWENGLLVSVRGTEPIRIGMKFLSDFISSLLIVIVLVSITLAKKKPLENVGIILKSPMLIFALLVVYLCMFLINGDFSAKGFYAAFFYLIIVAFSEELVFRGYLFNAIDSEFGFWTASVVSGLLFGALHAFMPSIVNSYDVPGFITAILSNLLGQGILGGMLFAVLYKKSKTIFVPVLIHAILDYSDIVLSNMK